MRGNGRAFFGAVYNVTSVTAAEILFAAFCVSFAFGAAYFLRLCRLLFLSRYLLAAGEGTALFCVRRSMEKMSGKTSRLFRFRVRLALSLASRLFVMPYAFIWGYYRQAAALFAGKLISE